jgi:GntR family transcriptional regulator, transcriptional repressor for pyruvate dehydrogenase complex
VASSELFSRVTSGRVSSQIVSRIRDAIHNGSLQPGDRLPPERELAERFGVSRVTVRDALRTLEVLGLVEVRVGAGGGPFVRVPGAEVVGQGITNLLMTSTVRPDEVAEARLLLELGTVGLATARATDEDLKALRASIEDARARLRAGTYESDIAGSWHLLMAEVTKNTAVRLLMESIRGPLSMSSVRQRGSADKSAHELTLDEHDAILEAIEARDGARAQGLMATHLLRDRKSPGEIRETVTALLGGRTEGLQEVLRSIQG